MNARMNNTDHICHKAVHLVTHPDFDIQDSRYSQNLARCERCGELIDILLHARENARGVQPELDQPPLTRLELTEIVSQLYERTLEPQKTANFLHQLQTYPQCAEALETMFEESFSPLPENFETELKAYSKISIVEQVLRASPPERRESPKLIYEKKWLRIRPFPKSGNSGIRRAAFALLLVTVIAGGIYWRTQLMGTSFEATFVYDDQVPYDYRGSSLRSAADANERNPELQAFIDQFKLAMGDYIARDYFSAIPALADLRPSAIALQSQPLTEESKTWMRDFYFYLGVSHLAASRTGRFDLDVPTRLRYARSAVRHLLEAKSVVDRDTGLSADREVYFLGLAYGFSQDRFSAIAQLKMIGSDSDFFKDSQRLIQEWSNE